jgi:hypothetical protein
MALARIGDVIWHEQYDVAWDTTGLAADDRGLFVIEVYYDNACVYRKRHRKLS